MIKKKISFPTSINLDWAEGASDQELLGCLKDQAMYDRDDATEENGYHGYTETLGKSYVQTIRQAVARRGEENNVVIDIRKDNTLFVMQRRYCDEEITVVLKNMLSDGEGLTEFSTRCLSPEFLLDALLHDRSEQALLKGMESGWKPRMDRQSTHGWFFKDSRERPLSPAEVGPLVSNTARPEEVGYDKNSGRFFLMKRATAPQHGLM